MLPPTRQRKSLISLPQSRVALYVLPTDEELMIARHTLRMLSEGSTRKLAAGM